VPDIVPTRSAFLELRDERGGMREGYRFLDEKRLVLAGEIVERLDAYAAAKKDFERLQKEAVQALRTAVEQHGLAELTFYPAQHPINAKVRTDSRNILGVMATSAELSTGRTETEPAVFASPPADACRQCFQ